MVYKIYHFHSWLIFEHTYKINGTEYIVFHREKLGPLFPTIACLTGDTLWNIIVPGGKSVLGYRHRAIGYTPFIKSCFFFPRPRLEMAKRLNPSSRNKATYILQSCPWNTRDFLGAKKIPDYMDYHFPIFPTCQLGHSNPHNHYDGLPMVKRNVQNQSEISE